MKEVQEQGIIMSAHLFLILFFKTSMFTFSGRHMQQRKNASEYFTILI